MQVGMGAVLSGLGYCDDGGYCYDDSVTASLPVAHSSTDWSGFLSTITKSAAGILGARYAVPQLNAGQSITTTPLGSQITQQPQGVPVAGASIGVTSSGLSSGLLIALAIGAVGLFAFSRKG